MKKTDWFNLIKNKCPFCGSSLVKSTVIDKFFCKDIADNQFNCDFEIEVNGLVIIKNSLKKYVKKKNKTAEKILGKRQK